MLSCIMGLVLGLFHWGVKSLLVVWKVFVKGVVFCAIAALAFRFAYIGAKSIGKIFLTGLVGAVLLKMFLEFLVRERKNTVWQRTLWRLNWFVLC
ncbi:hypothetical protein [Bartonella tribocorum]|uniref:Uncharacterized protein n=1 Tax=Bartonella tribocorum TaxID=85701 RepID=A0A2M6USL0_9HYPH|nr:hypothetical protein [Bartonella tribocorum]PIT69153.1 hypothetical protein CEV08_06655 [Bartonella tribocorum]